ncbi:MAG: hypothetical protein RSA70_01500 [Clostridia bacterium]
MNNRNIIVITDKNSENYSEFKTQLKPYLDFFGFPYIEQSADTAIPECALIMMGHTNLLLPPSALDAVRAGAGLVRFFDGTACGGSSLKIAGGHYITERHADGEEIALYAPMSGGEGDGQTLVAVGDATLLDVSEHGDGRICTWYSMAWMSHEVLGPIHGLDDILWRGIVWAAKKPFIMQGMPPMVGMRVDDVWGAWREEHPENPLKWVEIAHEYGIKPWLGVFQDNMNERTTETVREYTHAGLANAYPHAFVGCEWTKSDLAEHWIYFDHNNKKPYSDEVMKENAQRAKAWFDEQDIPISKMALAHYYETGANALKYIADFGCEFIGIHMDADAPYGSNCIKAGPYRNFENDDSYAKRPVYYGDYVFDGKFFNCVTEIRDVCGYEWAPTTDVADTIKNGTAQLKRALDSMVPAVFFTHESCWIQRLNDEIWDAELRGITRNISKYNAEFMTMEDICRYARAKHNLQITGAEYKNGKLHVQLAGKNDIETKCFVFSERGGKIRESLHVLPRVDGAVEVVL